jgi:virulence factor Mce-like protein
MRRLGALVVVLAAALATVALVRHDGGSATPDYHVDAIFDDARGLVPGQLVKIAGARVGTISDVRLTPGYRARVEMSVDGRFAPFHADATCTIRPQGLIAENYVECDPGTQDARLLAAARGEAPTVPVGHTTEPVNLTDLFNIFNTPTRDRFSVIVNELGIATAGRGDDINEILRRAAPALGATRKALEIVNGQRAQLAMMIRASDRLLGRLAPHRRRAQQFLDRAASVTDEVAQHRDALSETVAGLPALLHETRGALGRLDTVAKAGTPLLRSLRAAAPALNRVSRDIPAFGRAAPAATAGLGAALHRGTTASSRLRPVVRTLRDYAVGSLRGSQLSGRLYGNLRDRGFVESLLSLFYYVGSATSRFDSVSHILPAHELATGACTNYATAPVAGCSANYSGASARRVLDYMLGR